MDVFSNKTPNNELNKVQKRALRMLTDKQNLSHDELLELTGCIKIRTRNLQLLMTEIYRTTKKLNPPFMWNLLKSKSVDYDFRVKSLLKLPTTKTKTHGLRSFTYRGSILWNYLPDEYKQLSSLKVFKEKIKLKEINNIFINQGPGKFSGIRTSIAIAKGISITNKLNLYGFDAQHVEDQNYDKIIDLFNKGFLTNNLCINIINIQFGHSLADFECCAKFMNKYSIGFTHLYNAMSGNHHRSSGVLSAALELGSFAEIICDLNHVNETSIKIAKKCIKNLYAVSDSMGATGLENGIYNFFGVIIIFSLYCLWYWKCLQGNTIFLDCKPI